MFETARYVGSRVREVSRMDRAALEADGFNFNINILVGGQIAGQEPEIHYVYPQGIPCARTWSLHSCKSGNQIRQADPRSRILVRHQARGSGEIRDPVDGGDDEKQRLGGTAA
jgi:hypothetical protein